MSHSSPQFLSREEYRILVEQSPVLIWRADRKASCDYFNQGWLTFRGRTMEQETGNGWAEGVHPEDLDRCLNIFLTAFNRREIFEMEYRLQRHDGEYRWIFDRGAPVYEEEVFRGYVGSCIDVTDRVEAQVALKKSQDQEIRRLQGLLPICSCCKKIKNDKGYWDEVEVYVAERSEAQFSHGICPRCLKELYPQHIRMQMNNP